MVVADYVILSLSLREPQEISAQDYPRSKKSWENNEMAENNENNEMADKNTKHTNKQKMNEAMTKVTKK